MPTPSKVDQLRALREARFAQQKASASPKKHASQARKKIKADTSASTKRKKVATAKAALAATVDVSHMANSVANTSTAYRYRDPDGRREYQRELMRNRRAAKKEPT